MLQAQIRKLLKPLCTLGLALLWSFSAQAKLMEPAAIVSQIVANNWRVAGFVLQTRVEIYDPEALSPLSEEIELQDNLPPVSKKSFRQRITLVRDEFFGAESMNFQNKELNVYLRDGNRILLKDLQEQRSFSEEDVDFSHAAFYTKHDSNLTKRIGDLGIPLDQVRMLQVEDRLYYQLGSEEEYLLVRTDNFRVERIQRQIQIQGRYYPLVIDFSKWDQKTERIPHWIRYYIKGRLFKEVKVTGLVHRGATTQRRKLQKAFRKDLRAAPELIQPQLEIIDLEALLKPEEAMTDATSDTTTDTKDKKP